MSETNFLLHVLKKGFHSATPSDRDCSTVSLIGRVSSFDCQSAVRASGAPGNASSFELQPEPDPRRLEEPIKL